MIIFNNCAHVCVCEYAYMQRLEVILRECCSLKVIHLAFLRQRLTLVWNLAN